MGTLRQNSDPLSTKFSGDQWGMACSCSYVTVISQIIGPAFPHVHDHVTTYVIAIAMPIQS